MSARPRVVIRYCTRCNWMLRAAWLAQELLSTFGEELAEVAIRPDRGGVFEIDTGDGQRLWSRSEDGGFPEAKVLKQRLRDACFPDRPLGHADRDR